MPGRCSDARVGESEASATCRRWWRTFFVGLTAFQCFFPGLLS